MLLKRCHGQGYQELAGRIWTPGKYFRPALSCMRRSLQRIRHTLQRSFTRRSVRNKRGDNEPNLKDWSQLPSVVFPRHSPLVLTLQWLIVRSGHKLSLNLAWRSLPQKVCRMRNKRVVTTNWFLSCWPKEWMAKHHGFISRFTFSCRLEQSWPTINSQHLIRSPVNSSRSWIPICLLRCMGFLRSASTDAKVLMSTSLIGKLFSYMAFPRREIQSVVNCGEAFVSQQHCKSGMKLVFTRWSTENLNPCLVTCLDSDHKSNATKSRNCAHALPESRGMGPCSLLLAS